MSGDDSKRKYISTSNHLLTSQFYWIELDPNLKL